MTTASNQGRDPELLPNLPDRTPRVRETERPVREPTREGVAKEKQSFYDRTVGRVWRNKWKIAALLAGGYLLYHFRFWMREKLHLAFSKLPQSEIEGNMGTTATAGDARRTLPGNAEGRGTSSSSSSGGPFR